MNKAIENQENKCILSNKNTSNSGQKEENRKQSQKFFLILTKIFVKII